MCSEHLIEHQTYGCCLCHFREDMESTTILEEASKASGILPVLDEKAGKTKHKKKSKKSRHEEESPICSICGMMFVGKAS